MSGQIEIKCEVIIKEETPPSCFDETKEEDLSNWPFKSEAIEIQTEDSHAEEFEKCSEIEDKPLFPVLFKCELCSREYKRPWWLRIHKSKAHRQKRKKRCHRAGVVDSAVLNAPAHTEGNNSREGKWREEATNEMLLSAAKIFKTHPKAIRIQDKLSSSKLSGKKKSERFQCIFCSYSCGWRTHLEEHVRGHLGETPYKCRSCDFVCSQKIELMSHAKSHRSTGSKMQPKKEKKKEPKPKTTQTRAPLKDQVFECSYCDYSSKWKASLKIHEKRHVDESQNAFHCDICSFRGPTKSSLKLHSLSHFNVPIFQCSICDYASKSKSNTRMHEKRHSSPSFTI